MYHSDSHAHLSHHGVVQFVEWLGYGLDDRWNVIRFHAETRDLPPFKGYRLAMDPPGAGDKAAETWIWPLTPSSVEDRKEWHYTSTPPTRLNGVTKDNNSFSLSLVTTLNRFCTQGSDKVSENINTFLCMGHSSVCPLKRHSITKSHSFIHHPEDGIFVHGMTQSQQI